MSQNSPTENRIIQTIASELGAADRQVQAAVDLLNDGSTVPFIARYRKEATGGLDDTQLRTLEERLSYLREMEDRRSTILKSIEEQGKLDDDLNAKIIAADSKARLEDLYLPFKKKRRTKGQIAREAGIEPLADLLLGDPSKDPEKEAADYVNSEAGFEDVKATLNGARDILSERFAEDADLLQRVRDYMWEEASVNATVVEGKEQAGAKFSNYFDHSEPCRSIPSHRILAVFRGRKEEVLSVKIDIPDLDDSLSSRHPCELKIASHVGIGDQGRVADKWLMSVVRWCWRVKISLHVELELTRRLFEAAEDEAINVFASNLRDLLLASPAGLRPTLALDPGFRTGVKVAAIDATGKLLETATIYPHEPQRQWDQSLMILGDLCRRHRLELIACGNGTASRETDKLAGELIKQQKDLRLTKVMVSEAGASVYSASAFAAEEMPDIDVSLRGAASIGRRLQDPLAELVKIDPKSIGVGQYQHDVSEVKLSRSLEAVVEDCVNAVGVDVNTASAPLLARVSGIGDALARSIVLHRDLNGPFKNRKGLLEVSKLGPKAYEQCAGFLRIQGGENPLDGSAVHPEAYPLVERIMATNQLDVDALIGNKAVLKSINPSSLADDTFGVPTIEDILGELEKPGRDPRPSFKTADFQDGVETISDLKPGMILEGVVTNVANFGAFVDVGVHQDGLVHISALADKFVEDPRDVVRSGDVVKVKVLEVDVPRKRIGLTMRMADEIGKKAESAGSNRGKPASRGPGHKHNASAPQRNGSGAQGGGMAAAFAAAQARKR